MGQGWIARRESITTGAPLPNDPVTFRGRFVDGSGFLQGGVFVADTIRPLGWLELRAGGRFAFAHAAIPVDPLAAELGLAAARIDDPSFGFGGGLSVTFIPHEIEMGAAQPKQSTNLGGPAPRAPTEHLIIRRHCGLCLLH